MRDGQTLAELTETLDGIDGLTFSRVDGSERNVKGNSGFTVLDLLRCYRSSTDRAHAVLLTRPREA